MKPIIKLYNREFSLVAIIDDYEQASFEHNLYSAGSFTITINYNIPNARLFERGLFVQFGDSPYDFGEIITVSNSIGSNGKSSEYLNVTGYDARYLFKRRIIKNLNNNDTWSMTARGEYAMRSLIYDQCGLGAEEKRRLPINNTIPNEINTIGSTYSVSEAYSNLYDVLVTIATQSEIGWAVLFDGSSLNLYFYSGTDLSNSVFFSTDYESLASGNYSDSSSSYANTVYIGGKGTGSERDIYEGENGSPEGLDRFEAFDNQSSMTIESEYEAEALNMLSQYGQTISMSGAGLAKCPYIFREQYNIGDTVKLAFSGKSANVQILSVTESWRWNKYGLTFSFGKPINTINDQLNIILRKIQEASNKTSSTSSVKWYNIGTETEQDKADVTFDTLGFTGAIPSGGRTFTLYRDDEGTGAKNYTIYTKNLTGSDNLILTTGVSGKTTATIGSGNSIIHLYVDTDGNVVTQSVATTSTVEEGNTLPVTSEGVAAAIGGQYPIPIDKGGTNATTAKEAEYNLISGVETVETEPDDNRYLALRNQTLSSSKGTFRWTKCSSVWNWIKSKIQSIALTIGSTTSAIAETLYGSLTVKNSSGTTTASITQNGEISSQTLYANGYKLKRYFAVDLSGLSTSNFYPVTFPSSDLELDCEIHSPNLVGSAAYNQNLIHFKLIAQGWSDTPKRLIVLSSGRYEANETTIGCIAYGNEGGVNCVWLRGGMLYRFYCNKTPTLRTSDYSNGNEKFTVGTNYYGGSNSNLTICWTPGSFASMYTTNGIQASSGFIGALTGNATSATTAETANKIRTSAPSSPANGDIWIS